MKENSKIKIRVKLKCFAVLLLGIFISPRFFAQDFTADMKKVNQVYLDVDDFSMTIETSVFASKQSKMADQKIISRVMKLENNYKTITDILETIYTTKYVIAVSKAGKTIMYAPNDKKTANPKDMIPKLDSSFNKYDSVIFVGNISGEKHYRLLVKGTPVKEINMYFRESDYVFTRIDYLYRDKRSGFYKVENVFKNVNLRAGLHKDEFEVDHYIIDKDPKNIIPAPAYKGYKVIHNDFAKRNK